MALVIKKTKTFTWPVKILEPKDGGGFNEQKVRIKFNMIPQERIDEIIKNESEDDSDVLDEIVAGWDDEAFKDENGNSLTFNVENKALILSVPYVRTGMIAGFFEAASGKAAKKK